MTEFIEEGIVLSTHKEVAKVKITPKGTCPDNHAGCPVRALAKNREFIIDIDNSIDAQPGQRVKVEMKAPDYYKGLILVFVLPIVLLFIGYFIGIFVGKSLEEQEEIFGYSFMFIGFIFSFFVMGRFGKNFNIEYKIVEIINNFS